VRPGTEAHWTGRPGGWGREREIAQGPAGEDIAWPEKMVARNAEEESSPEQGPAFAKI